MVEDMVDILRIIQMLNSQLEKENQISKKEIEEEWDNIKDLSVLQKELKKFLNKLEKEKLWDAKEVCEQLVDLQLKIGDYIWHFEQIHEIIRKLITKYVQSAKLNQ